MNLGAYIIVQILPIFHSDFEGKVCPKMAQNDPIRTVPNRIILGQTDLSPIGAEENAATRVRVAAFVQELFGFRFGTFRTVPKVPSSSSAFYLKRMGAAVSATISSSLNRMLRLGPAVSLHGSPTVSPTTAAACAGECFPP